ncbi:P-loop containing nucleoside triphosphate hydrolase protein [Entophlyctis helioformis]|nr:P-loop containing nucleoside triphosphate hydrolase protein [Entophlyctis helioformis]
MLATVMHSTGFGYASSRSVARLRARLFRHLIRQDMAFFAAGDGKHGAARLAAVLAEDTDKIARVSGYLFSDVLRGMANVGLGLTLGLTNSWHMAVAMAAPVPLIVAIVGLQARISKTQEHQTLRDRAAHTTSEMVTKLTTITLLAREAHFLSLYKSILSDFASISTRHQVAVSLGQGLVESLLIVVFSLGLYAGGTIMVWGWATNEQVLVSLVTLTMTAISVNQVAGSIAYAVGPAAVDLQGVFDLLDTRPGIDVTESGGRVDAGHEFTGLRCENVSFGYNGPDGVIAVSGISFTVEPGTKVALIGPTGSGKSSIISLVSRLYDPHAGQMSFNGTLLRDWNLKALRGRIGMVPQSPDLFDASVRENIAYGRPDASDKDIERAARLANVHDFVAALPEGYETRIGENGSLLSGGQRQRIAIARIYLVDPHLIILDEATSALDADNEGQVISALESYAKQTNKGVLVITHRLETVRDADTIHLLSAGRIIGSGTHADLMAAQPVYRDLVASSSAASKPAKQ